MLRGEVGCQHAFLCLLKGCVRRVLYVPALHVSTATATGPAAPTKGFKRSKSAWRDDEETVDKEAFGATSAAAAVFAQLALRWGRNWAA